MTRVTLTQAQIDAGLHRDDYRLNAGQFTFSIPVAGSVWPGYAAATEPTTSFMIVTPAQAAAFRLALAAWDTLILPNFAEVADTVNTRGEVRVAFTSYEMDGGTAAYAYSGLTQSVGGKVGDVWVNVESAAESFAYGTFNYEVLVHEIGHTLGLSHSFAENTGDVAIPAPFENTRYTVMSYTEETAGTIVTFQPNGSLVRATFDDASTATPMVLDIAAVQAIYGADPTTRSGDTIYTFDQNDTFLQTIYDAGGIDTIDLSNFTRPSTIDLTPGAYSTVGEFTRQAQIDYWIAQFPASANFIRSTLARSDLFTHADNVGIAFSTTIENVTGGSLGDRITGNAVANVLLGMAGADVLMGGDGDDRLDGGGGGDTISGDAGDDLIDGGPGGDTLTGGAGADVFAFRESAYDTETITDFAMSEDRFDLVGRQFTRAADTGGGTTLYYGGGEIFLAGVTGVTLAQANARVIGVVAATVTLAAAFPADGAAGLAVTGDIRLAFASAVTRGAGVATLALADGTAIETFDIATSPRIGIAGAIVTIDPTRPLAAGTGYTLTIANGALSVGGVGYAGLSGYDFTTRASATTAQFQLLVADGVAASVSGSGTVFGTRTGVQDVTVLNMAGLVTFDPSFNAGGDRIHLSGNASDYTAVRSGSAILLSDGDTIVAVPVGPASIDIIFGDGVRTLTLDTVAGVAKLGGQAMTTTATAITAAAGPATATGAVTPGLAALLQLNDGGSATALGLETAFGTRTGAESVTVARGASVTFDPSFNAGRDTVSLPGDAATYTAVRSGSAIVLTSATETVTLPVGVVGATLRFDDAVRALVFDTASQTIKLGAQAIGTTAATVTAPAAPVTVALVATQSAAGGDFHYTQAGGASPDAIVTGFGRGDSLALTGDAARYVFAGSGGDISLSYIGTDGSVRTTTLAGIADPSVYVFDRASAEVAAGFGFATFGP